MMERTENKTTLGGIRVLDLTNAMGAYCTKLLADLGADVVKIEPVGGDATRRLGPFVHDDPHPEKSLYFFYFNTNKRSITLNLETQDGRDIFKKLVKSADIVVETFPPGYLEKLGIGYKVLQKINPGLIMTSITGFGSGGPYSNFRASDIVGIGMGGFMHLCGFPEDPPAQAGASQGYYLASVDGAIGSLMSLIQRDLTGKGQQVDVSMQGAVMKASETSIPAFVISKKVRKRTGLELYRGIKDFYPCKDGYVFCSALGGGSADIMLEWMTSEGMAADLNEERYDEVISIMGGRRLAKVGSTKPRADARRLGEFQKEISHIEEVWQAWLSTHTRKELYEGAQRRGVKLMPVNTAKELVEDEQLNARNFFVDVDHPELSTALKYPGAPYRFSETPWRIRRRAPRIGEDNLEVYKELGLSPDELVTLKGAGVI